MIPRTRNLGLLAPNRLGAADSGTSSEFTLYTAAGEVEEYPLGLDIDIQSAGAAYTMSVSRIMLHGPYLATESLVVSGMQLKATITTDFPVRATIYSDTTGYVDNGYTTQTSPALTSGNGGLPNTHIASGPETTLTVGTNQLYSVPITTTLTSGWYWIGLLTGNTGAGSYYKTSVTSKNAVRTNSGIYSYNSVSNPPSFGTLSKSFSVGFEPRMWLNVSSSTVTAPSSVTATANSNRSVTVVIAGGDTRAQAYYVERQKNGGAWDAIGYITSTTYVDSYLQAGATYTYRVSAKYRNTASSATTSNTVTAAGSSGVYTNTTLTQFARTTPFQRTNTGPIKWKDVSLPSAISFDTEYYRTGFDWSVLEPTQGNYDFSVIDTFLTNCQNNGRLGWFRVRCVRSTGGRLVPAYITGGTTTGGGDYVPDWDSTQVKTRIAALYAALGSTFANDTRLGLIDVGMYADYGEWRDNPDGSRAAYATLQGYLDACIAAFPNQRIVLSSPESDAIVRYALQNYSNIDIRQDALGDNSGFMDLSLYCARSETARNLIRRYNRARHVEHLSPGSMTDPASFTLALSTTYAHRISSINNTNMSSFNSYTAGSQANILEAYAVAGARLSTPLVKAPDVWSNGTPIVITTVWQNDGVDALHENWSLYYQLRNGSNTVVWSSLSSLDVTKIIPTLNKAGAFVHSETVTPSTISAGTYSLGLALVGPSSGYPNMRLAQNGYSTGGWYVIKTVAVS